MASTTTSWPRRRAFSSASSGKRPLPAIRPYFILGGRAILPAAAFQAASLNHSPRGSADERQQLLHLRALRNLRANPRHRLRSIQPGARQQAECSLQFLDGAALESAAIQARMVGAEHLDPAFANRVRERQHILCHHTVSADDGVPPHPAELVYARRSADHRPIAHRYMPAQSDGVSQHHAVTDMHVVRHVYVSHQQVVVADTGDEAAAFGAAMNGNKLADLVAVSDARFGPLAAVFQILRCHAYGAIWEKDVVLARAQRPFHVNVRHQPRPGADLHLAAYDRIRPDL